MKTVLDRKSISVSHGLIGSLNVDGDILSLILGEEGELSTKGTEVKTSDLLVEFLRENVYLALLVLLGVSVDPEIDLSDDLVGE